MVAREKGGVQDDCSIDGVDAMFHIRDSRERLSELYLEVTMYQERHFKEARDQFEKQMIHAHTQAREKVMHDYPGLTVTMKLSDTSDSSFKIDFLVEEEDRNPLLELRPCPFCGKSDTLEMVGLDEEDGCTDCSYTVVCSVLRRGCGAGGGYAYTPEEAAKKWNERAGK